MTKVSLSQIAEAVASAINQEGSHGFPWPHPWPHRFQVLEPSAGARLIVAEQNDLEIHEVPLEHVTNLVVAWLRLQDDKKSFLTPRQAQQCVETWRAIATPIPLNSIKSIRWKSEPGHTWRRLPWDMAQAPTPTWDTMLNKMSNAEAYKQWLGSLFFDEAKQHQYVWIHGMGNDGKGSMNRFLKKVFGRSYRSKQPPAPGDKFWAYGLLGARLVVFPDCNAQGFTASGLFKTLTGGDPIDVEAKGKMSFTAELGAKFLFLSNVKPNISWEKADMRRIIYCEFPPSDEPWGDHFEDGLWEEGGAFLRSCVHEYLAKCPRHQPILSNKNEIEDWISNNDEHFQHVFDQHFQVAGCELYRAHKELAVLTDEQFDLVTIKRETMLAVLHTCFPNNKEREQFKNWLYEKYQVSQRGVKRSIPGDPEKKTTIRRYIGAHPLLTKKAADSLERLIRLTTNKMRIVTTPDNFVD